MGRGGPDTTESSVGSWGRRNQEGLLDFCLEQMIRIIHGDREYKRLWGKANKFSYTQGNDLVEMNTFHLAIRSH